MRLLYVLIPKEIEMEDKKKKVKSFTLSPKVIEAIKMKSLKDQRSESQVVNMMLEKMLLA